MPNVLLQAPHYSQSRDGMCLPACVRMVLAYRGRDYSEAVLAVLLKTRNFGTPISNAMRLELWGLAVEVGPCTVDRLTTELREGRPASPVSGPRCSITGRLRRPMSLSWSVSTTRESTSMIQPPQSGRTMCLGMASLPHGSNSARPRSSSANGAVHCLAQLPPNQSTHSTLR